MPSPEGYYEPNPSVERLYRSSASPDLLKFRVEIGESDLWVLANLDLQSEIEKLLKIYRRQLKEYIFHHQSFAVTLEPYPDDPDAPELVRWMITTSAKAGVGPMAAVAGAIAGMIGPHFKSSCSELIIENGGDIYLHTASERVISVYAGNSIFSLKVGLAIPPQPGGLGVCTSAGTVGPSLSFGKADAAVIISPDVALADSAATATANLIHEPSDLAKAIDFARTIPGIIGVLVIKDDKMAVWGEVNLIPIDN